VSIHQLTREVARDSAAVKNVDDEVQIDGMDYIRSAEVESVALTLRVRHRLMFAPLDEITIAYLLRQVDGEVEEKEIDALAKAVKAPAIWRDVAAIDAVIWVDERYWSRFDESQREAVVLHELCHISVDDGKVKLLKHDVEEFGMVVRLYGPWRPDLSRFSKQLALFEQQKPA
jgi:predicted metallopeptidase